MIYIPFTKMAAWVDRRGILCYNEGEIFKFFSQICNLFRFLPTYWVKAEKGGIRQCRQTQPSKRRRKGDGHHGRHQDRRPVF